MRKKNGIFIVINVLSMSVVFSFILNYHIFLANHIQFILYTQIQVFEYSCVKFMEAILSFIYLFSFMKPFN